MTRRELCIYRMPTSRGGQGKKCIYKRRHSLLCFTIGSDRVGANESSPHLHCFRARTYRHMSECGYRDLWPPQHDHCLGTSVSSHHGSRMCFWSDWCFGGRFWNWFCSFLQLPLKDPACWLSCEVPLTFWENCVLSVGGILLSSMWVLDYRMSFTSHWFYSLVCNNGGGWTGFWRPGLLRPRVYLLYLANTFLFFFFFSFILGDRWKHWFC